MKQRKTTIHDIAKALNTTAPTVSRALNNHPRISDTMKVKVADMAKKLGYEPNTVASSLRLGHSRIIGVIVPYMDRAFFASVIRGIEEQARSHGYNVIICQTHEQLAREIEDVNTLLAAQVAGIIISVSKETTTYDHLERVLSKGKPLVLFDRTIPQLQVPSVTIDDRLGAKLSVQHLITNGYQKIAHVTGNLSVSIFRDRLSGYQEALNDAQLPQNPEHIVEAPGTVAAGANAIDRLLQTTEPPDAIFFASDFNAVGAIQRLKTLGIQVPEDMGIVGFGNDQLTQYLIPSVSSVDQQSLNMGIEAAKMFMQCLENKETNVSSIELKPKLIIRESSTPRG